MPECLLYVSVCGESSVVERCLERRSTLTMLEEKGKESVCVSEWLRQRVREKADGTSREEGGGSI